MGGGHESVAEPLLDLLAGRPTGIDSLRLIEGPSIAVIDPEQEAIMGTGQFVTHCVLNRVGRKGSLLGTGRIVR